VARDRAQTGGEACGRQRPSSTETRTKTNTERIRQKITKTGQQRTERREQQNGPDDFIAGGALLAWRQIEDFTRETERAVAETPSGNQDAPQNASGKRSSLPRAPETGVPRKTKTGRNQARKIEASSGLGRRIESQPRTAAQGNEGPRPAAKTRLGHRLAAQENTDGSMRHVASDLSVFSFNSTRSP
jgi:hypothetical protein